MHFPPRIASMALGAVVVVALVFFAPSKKEGTLDIRIDTSIGVDHTEIRAHSSRPRVLAVIAAAGKNAHLSTWDDSRMAFLLTVVNEMLHNYTSGGFDVDVRVDTLNGSSVQALLTAALPSPLPRGARIAVVTHDPSSFRGQLNKLSGVNRLYMHLSADPISSTAPPLTQPYDYYMYTDDDVLVPLAALRLAAAHSSRLWQAGRTLQLIRTEVNGAGEVVVQDWQHRLSLNHVSVDSETGSAFASITPWNFAAAYILPARAFGVWVADPLRTYFDGWPGAEPSRFSMGRIFGPPECFEFGFMEAQGQSSFLPLTLLVNSSDGGYRVHPDAFVPHLSNNYWKKGGPWAVIPARDVFHNGGRGAFHSPLPSADVRERWSLWNASIGWMGPRAF